VHLQVGLTQAFSRPVGQGGHAVRGEPEERGRLGGLRPLDLGVPEHGLPAFGQRGEGPGDHAPFQVRHRGVGEGDAGVKRLHLVAEDLLAFGAVPVVGGAADGGQQVGPERVFRPAAAEKQVEDLGEGLGDHVIHLGGPADELPGQAVRGGYVPLVQGGVRRGVAGPARRDEFRVAGRQGFRGRGFRGHDHYSPSLIDFK
jgi:hypothetical protein